MILLMIVAVVGAGIVGVSFPLVVRQHREDLRRARMTPREREIEDIVRSMGNLSIAVANLGPAFTGAAVQFTRLADALAVGHPYARTLVTTGRNHP